MRAGGRNSPSTSIFFASRFSAHRSRTNAAGLTRASSSRFGLSTLKSAYCPGRTARLCLRVDSDILESNGSSSMASVSGASLSLMDAGVPLRGPVAGVAMGLVKEGDSVAILTDIAGAEDHYGDMDFKVAGTSNGITALQMDIKVPNITTAIMREALAQAHRGRLHILEKMNEAIGAPRGKVSAYAP